MSRELGQKLLKQNLTKQTRRGVVVRASTSLLLCSFLLLTLNGSLQAQTTIRVGAFPNITQTGQTSADLQAKLMADAGVAALSGTAFGPYGEGFLRFSYANSVENIKLALEAIRAQLA